MLELEKLIEILTYKNRLLRLTINLSNDAVLSDIVASGVSDWLANVVSMDRWAVDTV